jgi:predicted metal-dependent hydrolase
MQEHASGLAITRARTCTNVLASQLDPLEPLEHIVREGARLFDEGRFFEAHEAWEAHWLVEKDETRRRLLQGLIQAAAALHKLDRNAPGPAASLFAKALAKLDACPATMEGFDVAAFRERVRARANLREA